MRWERPLLRAGEYLVRRSCRYLPSPIRDERYREWTAELPAILNDPDTKPAVRRAVRMLCYAADTIRGNRAGLWPRPAPPGGTHGRDVRPEHHPRPGSRGLPPLGDGDLGYGEPGSLLADSLARLPRDPTRQASGPQAARPPHRAEMTRAGVVSGVPLRIAVPRVVWPAALRSWVI